MTVPDAIAGLMAYLRANAGVAALAGTRVYGSELPGTEAPAMPRGAVVLTPSGGADAGGYVELGDQRVDVRCYGASPGEARLLSNAVYAALKQMPPGVWAGIRLHSARPESRASALRDPDTSWPLVLSVWRVWVAETAAV